MANLATATITINSPDDTEVTKNLFVLMNKWLGKDGWYRDIALASGVGVLEPFAIDTRTCKVLDCNGKPFETGANVIDIRLSDDAEQLIINVECNWHPMLGVLRAIQEKYAPEAEFIFSGEEASCDILWTNDPTVMGTYWFDIFDPDGLGSVADENLHKDMDYLSLGEGQAKTLLCEFLENHGVLIKEGFDKDVEELLKLCDIYDFSDHVSFHQWEETDAAEIG